MFYLQAFEDTIRIHPKDQAQPRYELLKFLINNKLTNKIIKDIGLIICCHDITDIFDSHILQNDGFIAVNLNFRAVLFRPFPDEIIIGTILKQDRSGVLINIKFFQEIFISKENLKEKMEYDDQHQLWNWIYEDDDDSDADGDDDEEEDSEENNQEKEPTKLPMRNNDEVRFVVTKIEFQDKSATQNISKVDKDLEGAKCIEEKVKDLPFVVYGSIRDECLGLLSWWSD